MGKQVPALFNIESLRLEGVAIDVLHAVDLGVCAHVVGNLLFEVLEDHREWGSKQEDRAAHLDKLLQKHYKDTKEVYKLNGPLSLERIRKSGDWPALRAKAAATRHMITFALKFATDNKNKHPHDDWRLGVVHLLNRFYEIIESEPMFPSEEARAELARVSKTFMTLYGKLSNEAYQENRRAWKITPKFHAFQHCCEHQSWINPRVLWTYGDESLQGLVKEVALSCHPRTMSYMTILKWVCTSWQDE